MPNGGTNITAKIGQRFARTIIRTRREVVPGLLAPRPFLVVPHFTVVRRQGDDRIKSGLDYEMEPAPSAGSTFLSPLQSVLSLWSSLLLSTLSYLSDPLPYFPLCLISLILSLTSQFV